VNALWERPGGRERRVWSLRCPPVRFLAFQPGLSRPRPGPGLSLVPAGSPRPLAPRRSGALVAQACASAKPSCERRPLSGLNASSGGVVLLAGVAVIPESSPRCAGARASGSPR